MSAAVGRLPGGARIRTFIRRSAKALIGCVAVLVRVSHRRTTRAEIVLAGALGPMIISTQEPRGSTFLRLVLQNPINRILMERLPQLGLQDAWLVAGSLFQTVWNLRSSRPPTEGIKDYDVFYFDGDDLSWESEDKQIRRIRSVLGDVGANIELRNQARVHLWYGDRFGPGYPPLESSCDGIDRFLVDCTRVAIRLSGAVDELYAPSGLDELYGGVLRPNPLNHRPKLFIEKAESYRARWPWLKVENQWACR